MSKTKVKPGNKQVPVEAMLFVLTIAFVLSHLYRTLPAVMAPAWSTDLKLSANIISWISACFHIFFAFLQLPIGLALDRFGVQRVLSGLLMLVPVGAFLSGIYTTAWSLIIGQVLIGAGFSATLMGTLIFISKWYKPERFTSLSGLIIGVGGFGMLLSSSPLAWLIEVIGWQLTFIILGCFTALIAGLCFAIVRDTPRDLTSTSQSRESFSASLAGILHIFGNRRITSLLLLAWTSYPVLITVRGLWIGSFLQNFFGLSSVDTGNAIFALSISMIVGPLAFGILERKGLSRSALIVFGGVGASVLLIGLVTAVTSVMSALIVLILFGLCSSFYILQFAEVRHTFPDRLAGRALTALNLVFFMGVAFWQTVTGSIAMLFADEAMNLTKESYTAIFVILGSSLLVTCFSYWRSNSR